MEESLEISRIESKLESAGKNGDITGQSLVPAFNTLPPGRFKKLVPSSFERANKSAKKLQKRKKSP